MLGRNGADSLQLYNDCSMTEEVSNISLLELNPVVSQSQGLESLESNFPTLKFKGQALLVDSFQEASAHRAIDVKHRTTDAEGLIPMKERV